MSPTLIVDIESLRKSAALALSGEEFNEMIARAMDIAITYTPPTIFQSLIELAEEYLDEDPDN